MDHKIILHLSLIPHIGPATVDAIITNRSEDMSLQDLYHLNVLQAMRELGLSRKQAEALVYGLADKQKLDQELKLIEEHGISWVSRYQETYPILLKEIHVPPTVLYWQGNMQPDNTQLIAYVGARKADAYGKSVMNQLVPACVEQGFGIVSGGALGADSMAHEATLMCGGYTIAVIGSGLLQPYPRSNKKLFERIITHGGAVVSPFPLHTGSMPGNFPARNRIIAGMSRACVVVQAARRSGARITAQCALEQGREVGAVPGPIDHTLSVGCHELIQEGAKLVQKAQDILIELGYQPASIEEKEAIPVKEISIKARQEPVLEDVSATIIRSCIKPQTIDELLEITNLCLPDLNTKLFELQLAGYLSQNMAGLWERI